MITIPEDIETVAPEVVARLHQKQWTANIYVKSCPYRRLQNSAWKRYFNHSAEVIKL